MTSKDKIMRTLAGVAKELGQVDEDWYVIGASSMLLSGIEIGETSDIDILTTPKGAEELKAALKEYIEPSPKTKDDWLFRSDFARFNMPLMDIEAMGGLQINNDGAWQDVAVNEYVTVNVNGLDVKVPTLDEIRKILLLFGREKDLRRLALLRPDSGYIP